MTTMRRKGIAAVLTNDRHFKQEDVEVLVFEINCCSVVFTELSETCKRW